MTVLPGAGAQFEPQPPVGKSTVAPELVDFWLKFHEQELCQSVDAVFSFRYDGMEIWCVADDDRNLGKLTEMAEPLRGRYSVDIYRTPRMEEDEFDRDPPPSLWNNSELRGYFREPFASAERPATIRLPARDRSDPEEMLKQRIYLFAQQALEWDRKMKRYAVDLPALTELARDAHQPESIRSRAAAAARAHAVEVRKHAERLTDSLSRAFPRPAKKPPSKANAGPPRTKSSLYEAAMQVSAAAQSVARRVYRFIHPTHHTVEIADLKQPSLLESLRSLQRLADDFIAGAGRER